MDDTIETAEASSQVSNWVQSVYETVSRKESSTAIDTEIALGGRNDEVRVDVTSNLTWCATLQF